MNGRKRKTTYFFEKGDRSPDKENNGPKFPLLEKPAVDPLPLPLAVDESKSEDDLDIGIRWKTSPKNHFMTNKITAFSSSPLRDITHEELPPPINEQAELMLEKYGGGFYNILTSKLSRTTSDMSYMKLNLELIRDEKLPSHNSDRLKKWISKLELDRFGEPQVMVQFQKAPIELELHPQSQPNTIKSQQSCIPSQQGIKSPTKVIQKREKSQTQSQTKLIEKEKSQKPGTSNKVKKERLDIWSDFSDDPPCKSTQPPQFYSDYTNDIDIISNINSKPESTTLSFTRPDLKRFEIVNIFKTWYTFDNKRRQQWIITVNNNSKLVVRGEYTTLNLQVGDIIHVIITDPQAPHLIDDTKNLLIWNPDILVSATTVAEQILCSRKSVLKDRFSMPGETSVPLLTGTILHEIFQSCFSTDWSIERMEKLANELVDTYRLQIYSLGEHADDQILDIIKEALPYLHQWFTDYYTPSGSSIPVVASTENVMFSLSKALDIEESIWSPMFGIKGKVDVSVQTQINHKQVVMPLELKTGKEYISHHAQTSLYALLFKDRYNIEVASFLLVYTKEQITKLGNIRNSDLRALVNLRNRISEFLVEGVRTLPQPINSSICDHCEVKLTCLTLHVLVEDGSGDVCGANTEILQNYTLLLQNHVYKDFYTYWDLLITKEEQLVKTLKRDLWTITAKDRELKHGKALANLVIADCKVSNDDPIYKYIYTFKRSNTSPITSSFQHSQLVTHDRVMLSDENGHFALTSGFIIRIRSDELKIEADRKINGDNLTFRIDKDEMFHGMGLARYNLLKLFDPYGDKKLRDLIVDGKPPKFNSVWLDFEHDTSLKFDFNLDQKAAFDKIVSANDYALVLGMPGTGKTTLIAGVINYLVAQGKTILLASYTHSAVDNILIKVKQYGISMLRVGHPSRVHKEILPFVVTRDNIHNYTEFQLMIMDPKVVGVTCLGINDAIFNTRTHFDYCIIDEASQVSLPVSLGPLRFADKYVLVGDHHQLPPLVQHPHPKIKEGLLVSLFQYLNDRFSESVVELTYQYRMCSDIMKLSNVLVYDNRLKCNNQEIANRKLTCPNPFGYKTLIAGERDTWMQWVVNENNRVVFLDHDLVPGYEISRGDKFENPTELVLISQIVEALILNGIDQSEIGIMSVYRAQLTLLNRQFITKPDLECMTADQFQGKDKDCVIISMVRSNKEGNVGTILQEWRRINVAVTRSRCKLIIVGSKLTLSKAPIMKEFIDLVMKEKWMYKLPPNALGYYNKPSKHSQTKPSISTHRISQNSPIIKKSAVINDVINESHH